MSVKKVAWFWYKCDTCGETTVYVYELAEHLRTHTRPGTRYACGKLVRVPTEGEKVGEGER